MNISLLSHEIFYCHMMTCVSVISMDSSVVTLGVAIFLKEKKRDQ